MRHLTFRSLRLAAAIATMAATLTPAVAAPLAAPTAATAPAKKKTTAAKSGGNPDFAFPKTVAANATKQLDQALKTGDDVAALRAAMNFELASIAIASDPEETHKGIEAIKRARKGMRSADGRSLASLLLASVYTSVYNSSRWIYDQRELPLTPLPDTCQLWSGDQFRAEISRLCNEALSASDQLKKTPLEKWAKVIEINNASKPYFPALFDFAATKAMTLISETNNVRDVIPLTRLCGWDVFITSPMFNPLGEPALKILGLYKELIEFHRNDQAPLIHFDLERLAFTNNCLFDPYTNRSDAFRKTIGLKQELYDRFSNSPYSGDILLNLYEDCSGMDYSSPEIQWLYKALQKNASQYPDFGKLKSIKDAARNLTVPQVAVTYPATAYPGMPLKVTVSSTNAKSVTVSLHRVTPGSLRDRYVRTKELLGSNQTASFTMTFDGRAPFNSQRDTTITIPFPGHYAIKASAAETTSATHIDRTSNVIFCSRVAVMSAGFSEPRSAIVVDPLSGEPVEGATVSVLNDKDTFTKKLGLTGANGMLDFADGVSVTGLLRAAKGTDNFTLPKWIYSWASKPGYHSFERAVTLTDLALYHPGDTVKWVSTVYTISSDPSVGHLPVADSEVYATFKDANRQKIESDTLKTDGFGRISGHFAIPKGLLTGNYSIDFMYGDINIGTKYFTVSDYKMPEFAVTAETPAQNTPADGDVSLSGKVMTYSGFPLADTNITMRLSVDSSPWFRGNGMQFYSAETSTDGSGVFTFVIPQSVMSTSPAPMGFYTADISATSTSGETQTTSVSFMTRPSYSLIIAGVENYDIASAVAMPVKVVDSQDKDVALPVKLSLVNPQDSSVVWEQTVNTSKKLLDMTEAPSGTFTLVARPDGYEAAERKSTVTLYRPTDTEAPTHDLLWTPTTSAEFSGKSLKALVSTSADTATVLATVWSKFGIDSQKWIKLHKGMNHVEINVADSLNDVKLNLATTHDLKWSDKSISFIRKNSEMRLCLHIESFRDRLVPGSSETWRIKTTVNDSTSRQSAVILDMYNSALDAIQPMNWDFRLGSPNYGRFSISGINYTTNRFDIYTGRLGVDASVRNPEWLLYGMPLFNAYSNYRMMKMARATGLADYDTDDIIVASEHKDQVVVEEAVYMNAAASVAEAEATEEVADEEVADAGAAPAEAQKPAGEEFSYRDSNVALAFFEPMLTTDEDGQLEFSFKVPDANTTWQLYASAFTRDMLTATESRKILANKPVMVAPNLPRFVRQGDKALLKAMVMNNSDSTLAVTTTVEIINPSDGRTIASETFDRTLEPGRSDVVATQFDVANGLSSVVYRVKSSTGAFTDGEQTLLPVLEAVQPVVESQTFYLAPDQKEFRMKINSYPADARVTLSYCANPLWTVVTALPGLSRADLSTPADAATAIYSAAVAEGLMRSNPLLAEAIARWSKADDKDSMLRSMLQKNDGLKQMLLEATPWVTDAADDTERMQRLALLLDPAQTKATISRGIEQLKRLATPSGGWKWMSQCQEPSLWATESALSLFGQLEWLGFMPDDSGLRRIVTDAVRYVDNGEASLFNLYPQSDFMTYAFIRNRLRSVSRDADTQRIFDATLRRAAADWKEYGLFDKAVAAILLSTNGRQPAADEIMRSISEFAKTAPDKGMWWPSLNNNSWLAYNDLGITALILEAYYTADSVAPQIDPIRQWLILQKEARNWGQQAPVTTVVSDILMTSPSWTAKAAEAEIMIDGRRLDAAPSDEFSGQISAAIPDASGKELTIRREGDTPAWGAVTATFISPIADLRPASTSDLAIEKHLYRAQENGGKTEWVETDRFEIGDRVRTELVIRAERQLDYVTVTDSRAACFEPAEQLAQPVWSEGICFYRENRDTRTNIFVTSLPKGLYRISYEMFVNNAGEFASGAAEAQSQYAPAITAHSGGALIRVADSNR